MKKCLFCYLPLKNNPSQEYHEKCSKKVFGTTKAPILDYSYSQIKELAKEVLTKRIAIQGVQPKLSLTIEEPKIKNDTNPRLTIVGLWDGIYVLKPPNKEYPELPENEDVTMHMAEACGIKTAVHSLIRFKSGELAYLAKRFDRKINRRKKTVDKLHQEDMCQLTELLTENKYNSSMEKVAKTTAKFTTNKGLELVTLFEVTVFSFLTGNSDMHLKNFSLIANEDGSIGLTPAYDLLATNLVVPEDPEEMALTLNARKNKLTKDDFKAFATYSQITSKAADNVFAKFEENLPAMSSWTKKSFLSDEMKLKYLKLIKSRAERLELKIPGDFLSLGEE